MYEKELIQRVCDLTWTENDISRKIDTIKYDPVHPFRKYYSFKSIEGAIEKFLANEWSDRTLAHWACIYCWILCGGCKRHITEDLNSFERFFRDVVTWDLDGLSFFSVEEEEDDLEKEMHDLIMLFKNYDHIWQTRDQWRAVYAIVGPCQEFNGEQYVVLINDTSKEYMIRFSDHLENGFEDKYFRFVPESALMELVEQLKNDGYSILSCSEQCYYRDIKDI